MVACIDCETILEMVLQYFNSLRYVFVWFRGPQTQKGRQLWGKLCHFACCKFGGTGHMFEAPGCRFCWPCNLHNNCHNELFPSIFLFLFFQLHMKGLVYGLKGVQQLEKGQ